MLLCLSSAAMPRYRQDILRALAMPVGSRLQFRYKLKWVAQRLHEHVKSDGLKEQEACIAYIDQSQPARRPEIVPVRAAKVVSTAVQGEFCVVDLELTGFAHVQDLPAFNNQLRTVSGNLPDWVDGSLKGHYFDEIDKTTLAINVNADTGEWQATCKALDAYKDFQSQKLYYRLEDVREVASGKAVQCKKSALQLRADELYDLQLLHYSPRALIFPDPLRNEGLNWLHVEADDKALTFVSTTALAVDSNYDIKTVRLRAATTPLSMDARISFSRRLPGAIKPEEAIWDFDLHARIRPRWWALTWRGLVVGVPVAAQGLVLTLSNANISNQKSVASLVILTGLLSGLFASFGLRRG